MQTHLAVGRGPGQFSWRGADSKSMKKRSTAPAKQPVKETTKEQAKIGSVEVEALAHNVARLVE